MQTSTKLALYSQYDTYEQWQAAYFSRDTHPSRTELERIHSDIKNELSRQAKLGYTVSRADAYAWRRNAALHEAGPDYLQLIRPHAFESEPYKSLCSSAVPPAPAVYDYRQVLESDRWPLTKRWIATELARNRDSDQFKCLAHILSRAKCVASCRGRWLTGYTAVEIDKLEQAKLKHRDQIRRARAKRLRDGLPIAVQARVVL